MKQPTFEELIGQRFGRLTVVEIDTSYVTPKGKRIKRLKCKCDCSTEECERFAYVQKHNLLSGKAQSCGCLQRELASKRAKERYNGTKHPKFEDLTGRQFGRLTVVGISHFEENEGCIWECKCSCGNEKPVYISTKRLKNGSVQSCGCLRDEKIAKVNRTHGKSHKSRLYEVWVGMRQRCNDPNHKSYHNYGGRGISVCKEWDDFEAFESWALGAGYDENAKYGACTLDRIDVDGDYEPSNCRWADAKTQAKNKRKKKIRKTRKGVKSKTDSKQKAVS